MKQGYRAYLEKYSEPDAQSLDTSRISQTWDEFVFIPSYGENEILDDCLNSLEKAQTFSGKRCLVTVLVNGVSDESSYGSQNQALLKRLKAQSQGPGFLSQSDWLQWGKLSVLLVDRTFPADKIPTEGFKGVGWARKWGGDLGVRLHAEGKLHARHFHTTDADARVAENYLELPTVATSFGLGKKTGVCIHPFQHEGAEVTDSPMGLYDLWLRYYEDGLRYAGSPFAFPTIGSLLSIYFDTYVAVRGFPRREAAEDYYFLSKASKVSEIFLGGGKVTLRLRESARVPFGTGVGVSKIKQRLAQSETFKLYDPRTFSILREVLSNASQVLQGGDKTDFEPSIDDLLVETGYHRALKEALQRNSLTDRDRTFHSHWDAFKTLKFIHRLRDTTMPEVPWQQAKSELKALLGSHTSF